MSPKSSQTPLKTAGIQRDALRSNTPCFVPSSSTETVLRNSCVAILWALATSSVCPNSGSHSLQSIPANWETIPAPSVPRQSQPRVEKAWLSRIPDTRAVIAGYPAKGASLCPARIKKQEEQVKPLQLLLCSFSLLLERSQEIFPTSSPHISSQTS